MTESRQTEVCLHDIQASAVEQLVQFAYTAEINIGEKNVQVRNYKLNHSEIFKVFAIVHLEMVLFSNRNIFIPCTFLFSLMSSPVE